jgi:hypothetical protein
MARIDWAIPCRYVEVTGGTATIVGAGVDTYWVDDFPAHIEVLLAVRIVGLPDELRQQTDLLVRMLDPDMSELGRLEGSFTGEPGPGHYEGWEIQAIEPLAVRFEALVQGAYTVDLQLGGKGRTVTVMIAQGPPPSN